MADKTPAQIVAELEAERAQRSKEANAAADAQRVTDLTAVIELEAQHGASGVKVIRLPVVAGLPTLIVVKRAAPGLLKRYRDQQTLTKKNQVDLSAINRAAEDVASESVVYPDKDLYARVRETFGGVHSQAGLEAIRLAEGKADEDEKNS